MSMLNTVSDGLGELIRRLSSGNVDSFLVRDFLYQLANSLVVKLPTEIYIEIGSKLPAEDIQNFLKVIKLSEKDVNRIWELIFKRDFSDVKDFVYDNWEGLYRDAVKHRPFTFNRRDIIWQHAVNYGSINIIKAFLLNKWIDPSTRDNYAIKVASERGYLGIIRELLKDPRVDPSAGWNHAITFASAYGYIDIVKELLKNPRLVLTKGIPSTMENNVDPSANDNLAIRKAVENGHMNVVNELLKDRRVDPSARNNYVYKNVAKRGCMDIVNQLLKDPRVIKKLNKETDRQISVY